MIRNKTGAFALAGAFAVGGAGLLYAQAEDQGTGMMGTMASCPMMQAAGEGPGAVLEHRDTLDLNADQVARLQSLAAEWAAARRATTEQMRAIHEEIATASAGDAFDEAAARDAFRRMGDLHAEVGLTMLRTRHQTRQALTAEQRQLVTELRSGHMGMHSMQGMGGMMEMMQTCPMLEGGMGSRPLHESTPERKEDVR